MTRIKAYASAKSIQEDIALERFLNVPVACSTSHWSVIKCIFIDEQLSDWYLTTIRLIFSVQLHIGSYSSRRLFNVSSTFFFSTRNTLSALVRSKINAAAFYDAIMTLQFFLSPLTDDPKIPSSDKTGGMPPRFAVKSIHMLFFLFLSVSNPYQSSFWLS